MTMHGNQEQSLHNRWFVRALLLCVLVGIGIIASLMYEQYIGPPTITRTDDGFKPKELTIDPGETVTFVNKSDEYFWPAANSHPSHLSLPDFDAHEPFPPGASWTFTFETVGPWGFHDHLYPGHKGVIIVGSADATPEECEDPDARLGTRFHCWNITTDRIIKNEGFEAVFDWFSNMYENDIVFRDNCHDVMHGVGEVAYLAFENDHKTITRPETAYCGYGFYHGFIESALVAYGPEYEERSREYCDAVGESDQFESTYAAKAARDACDHGIGHAVFDSLNSSIWGDPLKMAQTGLASCERMFPDDQHRRTRCGSGVSNSLANAYSYKRYNLVQTDDFDPITICKDLKREFQKNCYIEVGMNSRNYHGYNATETIAYFMEIDDPEMIAGMLLGFMDNEIRYMAGIDRLDEMHKICTSFDDDRYVDACIEGALTGLRNGGAPGNEAERMQEFCTIFKDNDESRAYAECITQMLSKLLGISSKEEMGAICSNMEFPDDRTRGTCTPYLDGVN